MWIAKSLFVVVICWNDENVRNLTKLYDFIFLNYVGGCLRLA